MLSINFSKIIWRILNISSPFKFSITQMNESVKEYTSSSSVWSGETQLRTLESVRTYLQKEATQCMSDSSKSSQTLYGGCCFSSSFINLSISMILRLKSPSWGYCSSISFGIGAY